MCEHKFEKCQQRAVDAETADVFLWPEMLAVSLQLQTDAHLLMAAVSATAVALPVDALAAVPAAAAQQLVTAAAAAAAAAVSWVLAGVGSCVLHE